MTSAAQRAPTRSAGRWSWVVGLEVLVALALLLLATRLGPGISPDSVAYVSTAQNLSATGHLTMFDGRPLTYFPPGMPLLLAGGASLGLSAEHAALALNAAAVAGTVVCTFVLGRLVSGSAALGAAAAGWLSVSVATSSVSAMLWTEPVFTLLCVGTLLVLSRMQVHATVRVRNLAALAALVSSACILRYAGLALVALAGVVVMRAMWQRGVVRALAVGAVASALCAVGLAVVVLRNLDLGVGPLGPRSGAGYALGDVAHQVLSGLGALVLGTDAVDDIQAVAAGLCLLLLLVGSAIAGCRGGLAAAAAHPVMPVVAYTVLYGCVLVVSELRTVIDPIGYRLLSPAAPGLAVATVLALRSLAGWVQPRLRTRWVPVAGAALGATYLAVTTVFATGWALQAGEHGVGYNSVALQDRPWEAALRDLAPNAGIVSNQPFAVVWRTGRQPVRPALDTLFFTGESQTDRIAETRSFVTSHQRVYLAWLGGRARSGAAALSRAGFVPQEVDSGRGYTLYRLRP